MFAYHYASLRAGQWPPRNDYDAFDIHVLGCALANALGEAEEGNVAVTEALGLGPGDLIDVLNRWFPLMRRADFRIAEAPDPQVEMEEQLLRDLLIEHALPGSKVSRFFAAIIARRAMRDDHLWQDLGLFDRKELSRLLSIHFPSLYAGNTQNMRWKKYFYRVLCEKEGFVLCTAPSCNVCTDFAECFGEEDGMSRMAQMKREVPLSA